VARVSAAVLIDGTYEQKEGVAVYQPRDPAELSRLEEIVKSAIGFSAVRGDSIRVEGAKFSRIDAPEPEPAPLQLHRYLPFALAALGFLTLLSMFMIFMKAVKSQKPLRALSAAEALAAGEATGSLEAGEVARALPGRSAAHSEDPKLLEERRAAALNVASKDPTGTALILSQWLGGGAGAADAAAAEER
jgi:flagellar M-ring protein FliF